MFEIEPSYQPSCLTFSNCYLVNFGECWTVSWKIQPPSQSLFLPPTCTFIAQNKADLRK